MSKKPGRSKPRALSKPGKTVSPSKTNSGRPTSQVNETALLEDLRAPAFWAATETKQKLSAMVPEYRLSKFQRVLPDPWQVEMVAAYLLDLEGTAAWLAGGREHE